MNYFVTMLLLKLPWDLRRGGGQDTDTLSPTLTDGQQFTPSHSTRQPEDINQKSSS